MRAPSAEKTSVPLSEAALPLYMTAESTSVSPSTAAVLDAHIACDGNPACAEASAGRLASAASVASVNKRSESTRKRLMHILYWGHGAQPGQFLCQISSRLSYVHQREFHRHLRRRLVHGRSRRT